MIARYINSRTLLLSALIIFQVFASGPVTAQTLRGGDLPRHVTAVIHCDYPPITFFDKASNMPAGFFADLMNVVAGRAGLKVSYICRNSWPEMIEAVEDYEADLTVLMRSAEREKRLLYTHPIEMTYLSYFALAQSPIDMAHVPPGTTVGAIKGGMAIESLKNRTDITFVPINTYQQGIMSLLAGEIRLFAGEESMVLRQARESGLDDRIKKMGMPFLERERGIAVRKRDVPLLNTLNTALTGFIGNDEYQRIYLKWYGKPTPYWTTQRIMTGSGIILFIALAVMAYWRYRSIAKLNQNLHRTVNELQRAEAVLQQSEDLVRNILNSVDEGFIVVDRNYRILTANRAYCSQVDATCDKVIGSTCHEISHGSKQPCFEHGEECSVEKAFELGEPCKAFHKHTDKNGSVIFVETKAFPIRDKSGAITSVVESVNNITEKYLLEAERLKIQKLEAIGTLAGGIAHDFNNLLQGVFGFIAIARMKKNEPDETDAALEQAERALQMAVKLTNQLLTFSKGGKPVTKRTDLRPVIENAAKFALSGSRSQYRLRTDPGLWQSQIDDGQIGQVIQNIVLNADQAMPDGGQVEITACNTDISRGGEHPLNLAPGKYVKITITDTGTGIPASNLSRIFDPYFTTKERGSGLGLATSYSIIKNHNGLIDVNSMPGRGSTFELYLPAADIDKAGALSVPVRPVPSRNGRVLLMDDDEVILKVGGELLRVLGHKVDVARTGEEALEKYERTKTAGEPFDVVILDLTVRGGMGGADAARRLRAIDPMVRTILSSGYSDQMSTTDFQQHGFKAFLKKPYNIDNLRDILQQQMSGAGRSSPLQ